MLPILLSILVVIPSYLVTKNTTLAVVIFAVSYFVFSSYIVMLLPRKIISGFVGMLMSIPLGFMQVPVLKIFSAMAGVITKEVEKPLEEYATI